jgi:hypothetical protein
MAKTKAVLYDAPGSNGEEFMIEADPDRLPEVLYREPDDKHTDARIYLIDTVERRGQVDQAALYRACRWIRV